MLIFAQFIVMDFILFFIFLSVFFASSFGWFFHTFFANFFSLFRCTFSFNVKANLYTFNSVVAYFWIFILHFHVILMFDGVCMCFSASMWVCDFSQVHLDIPKTSKRSNEKERIIWATILSVCLLQSVVINIAFRIQQQRIACSKKIVWCVHS